MSAILSRYSVEHAVAGSTGTVLATLLLFPLERVKTLVQVQPGANLGVRQVLERVLREEGPDGLYKGCGPMLQTVGTSNFLYFLLFEGLKDWLAKAVGRPDGEVGPYETLTASAMAGALNMALTEPLWRACVIAQAQTRATVSSPGGGGSVAIHAPTQVAPGAFGTVRRMWLAEGPGALWRGLGSSLWLVCNPVIQFFAYDLLKAARLNRADISSLEAFVIGAVAKAIATVLTFPLQVAQSRLRNAGGAASGGGGRPELQGMIPCLRAVLQENGVGGLYFGLLPKLVQTVTQAAFMFAIYEKVHWAIRRLSRKGSKSMRLLMRHGLKRLR
mmetsp:Transcript_7086/g.21548  ORF Transcript_7086/g.21548 Transcript_7086/m.21548 type:complete len:330 (-) Transcript_7086:65-1054(-)